MFRESWDTDLHATPRWSSSLTGRSCLPASGRGGAGPGPLRLRLRLGVALAEMPVRTSGRLQGRWVPLRVAPAGMPVRTSDRLQGRWVPLRRPGDRESGCGPRPWIPPPHWGHEPALRPAPSRAVPETLGPAMHAVRDARAQYAWSAVPLAFQGSSAPPRPASSHCRWQTTCSGPRHGQSCGARVGCGCPDQSPNSGTEGKKAARHLGQ